MTSAKPKPRFKKGDTVYVSSRYDGIVSRVIQAIAFYDYPFDDDEKGAWTYELNEPVQVQKDGQSIGVGATYLDELNHLHSPAPEYALMLIGDNIFSTHLLFGGSTDEILTIDRVSTLTL